MTSSPETPVEVAEAFNTDPVTATPPLDLRQQTLACLQQILAPYNDGQALALFPELQPYIGQLKALQHKINQGAIQIAVFGYVSRGKSALLNALLEEPILPIGALNGVTQWPRSIQWQPFQAEETEASRWKIELVDTPGLDEVDGGDRAQMAFDIARASDLLLFVVAGIPNPSEIQSLKALYATQKTIFLIANKADLYPNLTPQKIWERFGDEGIQDWIQPEDIILAAAYPAAKKVRNEWPDGRITEDWEVQSPDVSQIRDRLQHFLLQDGQNSLLRNALEQAKQTQDAIAQLSLSNHVADAQDILRRFALIKAIAVGMLPFWWLDAPVNLILDLLLVRSLVNLYQLPTTRHQVEDLWRTIFFSLFGVLACDLVSGAGLGIGSAVGDGLANFGGVLLWGSTAILQAIAAGYGAQKVGAATQKYLAEGNSWEPQGAGQLLASLTFTEQN